VIVHDRIGQFEALLATIFRPHNSYCIYVDSKADSTFQKTIQNLIEKYRDIFPQVIFLFV